MLPVIIISSSEDKTSEFIHAFAKEHNIDRFSVHVIEPEGKELSIAQIRDLKKQTIFSTIDNQLFVLKNFSTASHEAQNALLKTLEEHQQKTYFILVTTSAYLLLPTIQSRCKIVELDRQNNKYSASDSVSREVKKLIDGDIKALGSSAFYIKKQDSPLHIFDELIRLLQSQLRIEPKLAPSLKKIVQVRYGVAHNNVDPQNALDLILISIYNHYRA